MSIALDSNVYKTHQISYAHSQDKTAALNRTLSGGWDRVESGIFTNSYKIGLICSTTDIANLRTSFNKTSVGNNKLDFIDEENTHWNPLGSGGGVLNTGVYFVAMSAPKPMSASGWVSQNRFVVEIQLVSISQNILS